MLLLVKKQQITIIPKDMWTANLSTHMKDTKDIKEAIISYGMISEHVRQLLKTWSSRNWITLND